MTLPGIRAEAARIITNHGAREDQAESITPDTGEKAEPPAAVASATKPTEYAQEEA